MGKASRRRHRAKEQKRAKERARQQDDARQAGGPAYRPSAASQLAELAGELVTDAVNARFREDADAFEQCAAQLADGPGTPGWPRIADQALLASLLQAVTSGWRRGWQPAELVRHVSRMADARHVDMAAGRAVVVGCALEVLYVFAALPELARLAALPGAARSGVLATDRRRPSPADQRMLGRVRALLAKAESTEFPAEAEALTVRAQELMARHSIDYALLAASSGSTDAPSGRRLFLESPYEAPKALLLDVVAAANRSRAVWHQSLGLGTVLGFPADLDAVEMLFTSLLVQATTAMMHAGSQRDAYGRSRTRSFRQSFLTSYAQRIGERLAGSAGAAREQAAAASPGTDLVPVLAARDRAVDQAADDLFPALTQRSVTSASDQEGWLRGRAAADLAPLHGRHEVTGER